MTALLQEPKTRRIAELKINSKILGRILATGSAILIWHWFTEIKSSDNPILSLMGPSDTFGGVQRLWQSGVLVDSVLISLQRLLIGLAIASFIGILVGLIFGLKSNVEYSFSIVVQFFRMTSPLAWAPVAVMLLGIGSPPVIFLISIAAVWPIVLSTSAGVRAVDSGWLKVAKSLGASNFEIISTVVLPAIRGHILTGIRLALGVGWIVLVPAEMLGVDSGLGFAILNARDQLSYDNLAAAMFLSGLVGFFLDLITQKVFARFGGK